MAGQLSDLANRFYTHMYEDFFWGRLTQIHIHDVCLDTA